MGNIQCSFQIGGGTAIRILFITQICPYPPSNGGAIKTFNILTHLGSKHRITLVVLVRNEAEVEALEQLRPYCAEIRPCMIHRSVSRNCMDAASSLARGRSFIISRDYRKRMSELVTKSLEEGQDLIYADHLQVFQYVPDEAPCPVLLDEHNVEWRIIERFAKAKSSNNGLASRIFAWSEWPKLRTYELGACAKADHILTVTEQDRAVLAFEGIPLEKITSVPIGTDVERVRPVDLVDNSSQIISIGTMSWPPNADSALFFCSEIFPLVREAVPEARFSIVGSNPPAEITALGKIGSSVEVTGFVRDVTEKARESAVFVVPLRVGSGMRVKILDAMAMGLPVVTTSIGCEGINVRDGEHVIVPDTPGEFAKAVIRLLRSPKERVRIAAAGRKLVEESYSWPMIFRRLDSALARLQM